MKFSQLVVVAKPWIYASLGDHSRYELKITVTAENYEVGTTMILEEDDFESRFDFVFNRAREALRVELDKQRKINK